MKKVILSMLLMFVSAVAYSQGVIGKWVTMVTNYAARSFG